LQLLPPEEQGKTWTFLAFVFWFVHRFPPLPSLPLIFNPRTRNGDFVKALISQGLISSIAELDDFVSFLSFTPCRPTS
jgi:hypothetical protein